jgi:hypothetical protein
MNPRYLFALSVFATAVVFAADLPPIPSEPIAKKKELLFEDDFSKAEPAKEWHKVVPTFTFENGMLKGTQTRDKMFPRSMAKPPCKRTPPCTVWKFRPRIVLSK